MGKEAEIRAISREQFEIRLDQIEMECLRAKKSARTLQLVMATPRENAMQRSMNIMVEDMIIQLEMEANVTVAVTRSEEVNHIPFPPMVNRKQTMLNWDNRR